MSLRYWLRPKEVWVDVRYTVRRFVGFFQRGYRGWAPHDTWSFDKHLALVIAEGLEHMAKHAHGVPGFVFEENPHLDHEAHHNLALVLWKQWLRDKAYWFRWYYNEEIGLNEHQTAEEKGRLLDWYDKQEKHFYNVVLPDFGKRFGNLWD